MGIGPSKSKAIDAGATRLPIKYGRPRFYDGRDLKIIGEWLDSRVQALEK